jgi:glycerol kinase
MKTSCILALDQGTTSSRSMIFGPEGNLLGSAQAEFKQHFPKPGWVEHDPEEIWQTQLDTARQALREAGVDAGDIAGIGITNQRETVVLWDRKTGAPIHPAIVWQDRRTADRTEALKKENQDELVRERSGLLLDPYFSGTKVQWMLDQVE